MNPADMLVTVTLWPHTKEPNGEARTLSWAELCAELRACSSSPHDGRAWAPAKFSRDYRLKANVEQVFCLTFDVDSGAVPYEAVADVVRGFAAVIHTTKKSTTSMPRWRVVVLLDRSTDDAGYTRLWRVYERRFAAAGIVVDRGTKDGSRLWYLPSLAADGAGAFEVLAGAPLDVDRVLAEAGEELDAEDDDAQHADSQPALAPFDDVDAPAGERRYVVAALRRAADLLRATRKGARNATLAREAFSIGGLIGPGRLDREEARAALLSAISGWDPAAMQKHKRTLDRGLKKGETAPRTIEPRAVEAPRSEAGAAGDELPEIIIGTDLGANVDQCIEALRRDPDLYVRDGALVQVAGATDRDEHFAEGATRVRPVRLANLVERASRGARWLRERRTREGDVELVSCLPSRSVVEAVAARDGHWPGLRDLVGLAHAPFLRPSGTICDRPGYDPATRVFLDGALEIAPIPDAPSREDANAALASLQEVLCDFPWATPSASVVVIALILTLLARPAIDGPVPLFIIDKNTPGTGGSLIARVVSLVALGREPSMLSWPGDDTELEKILASLALGGASLVTFDNVSKPIEGAPIDKVATSTRCQLRVLGKSEVPELIWRAALMWTGNNCAVCGDTPRRVLRARMETALERPEDRSGFRHADLAAHVREHRATLVRAALVLLRAYVVAGRPDMKLRAWGSYESWRALVPNALVWAGAPDPMACRILDPGADDPERAALGVLVRDLAELVPDGATLKSIVALLYTAERERSRQRGEPIDPDRWDEMRSALETLATSASGRTPDPRKLGSALKKFRGRVVRGRRLASTPNRDDVQVWRSEFVVGAGGAGCAGGVFSPYAGDSADGRPVSDHAYVAPHRPRTPPAQPAPPAPVLRPEQVWP